MSTVSSLREHRTTFECFGSQCTVIVADAARDGDARAAAARAKGQLLEWHAQFSRFRPDSELSRLNADPSPTVPVTPMMRRIVQASIQAASLTQGVVDPTLVSEIERAGYDRHLEGPELSLERALATAPPRRPAGPTAAQAWRTIEVDRSAGTITRPPGVKLDPGGIAKGVFADELATLLAGYDAFVVDCGGDLRIGGRAAVEREVHVASPSDTSTLHTFELSEAGIATSAISKRSWERTEGRPGHHLLDPRTGEPAFTGVVQATAIANTAAQAEIFSKAALLAGPEGASRWLTRGGVVVLDDGRVILNGQPAMTG